MKPITVYNQKGEKTGTLKLSEVVFGAKDSPGLIIQAVVRYLANKRQSNAKAKTKAEVSGGGRKPHKQKGTGRARAGSIRSPLWRGGGITFGPTGEENYKIKMSKVMRRQALLSALSNKLVANEIILIDKIVLEKIQTKQIEVLLNKLKAKEGTYLFVLPKIEPKVFLSLRNLPYVKTVLVEALNIFDVMKYDYLILTKDSVKRIEEFYGKKPRIKPPSVKINSKVKK